MYWRTILSTTATVAAALLIGLSAPTTALAQGPGQGGRPGFGGGRFFGGMFAGMQARSAATSDPLRSAEMALLTRPDVQRTLMLTVKQKDALAELQNNAGEQFSQRMAQNFQDLRNMTPEERRAQRDQFRDRMQDTITQVTGELNKQAEAILKPDQVQRLRELDLQWRGPLALNDPKVAEAMALEPEQKEKLAALLQEFRQAQQKAMQTAFAAMRPPQPPAPNADGSTPPPAPQARPNPMEMQARFRAAQQQVEQQMEKVRKGLSEKALAVLTDEQRQRWQTLQGKPFLFRNLEMPQQ